MRSATRRLALLPLLLTAAACAGGPPLNVLFVVSDTLRAESMSCYGGDADTPNLCRLADEGVLFERAYANAPWTLPSVVSMFTGTYPLQHRRTMQGRDGRPLPFYFVDDSELLLGEALAEQGYEVTAVMENTVAKRPQVLQGFTEISVPRQRRGEVERRVRELAAGRVALEDWNHGYPPLVWSVGRLLEASEPFFHLHWIDDPHAPYRPPQRLLAAAGLPRQALPREPGFYLGLGHQNRGGRRNLRDVAGELDRREAEFLRDLYHLEIESVDRRIGSLLAALDAAGLRQRTLIVFTSDHGEEFGEHGGFLHDHALWEEVIRVPLIVAGPGVRRGHRVRGPVSLVDLTPTLADLLGIEGLGPFQGRSLRPLLAAREDEPRPRHHYVSSTIQHDAEAVIHGRYKLIAASEGEEVALYDLEADPDERNDLSAELAATVAELRAALMAVRAENQRAWQARFARDHPELRDAAAEKTEESLRALGYVD